MPDNIGKAGIHPSMRK
ncbi:hypothetical protein JMJ77_0002298 [Colletotrichum scovillei]|uniref:Uncharacterized protein n=1 Tax=Colletotrichum scovillei TaxID=1209932 RepID=A0A9P7UE16_9PEZI|nr:hypothetical protein JMJ77_0002298 [Colletotrichum scovillei]KAG7070718.1 hypothetical protein JMJ76_0001964 [Colletotrichum scovillei]KAG7078958.1 hypothetical protein JMJ78_0002621 [Colletotrichum scovillei]